MRRYLAESNGRVSRNLNGYRVSLRTGEPVQPIDEIEFRGMEKVRLVFEDGSQHFCFILSMQLQLARNGVYAPSKSSIYMDCCFFSTSG